MNFDISTYIENEMARRGIKKYKVEPEYHDVGSEIFTDPSKTYYINKYRYFIRLNNDIYLFVNQGLDASTVTKVEIIGQDNYYPFTKNSLESSSFSQYQFFSGEIEIRISHTGGLFIPPRLEFLRITPIFD